MINIISTQVGKHQVRGPFKVFRNLIKGLDKIGFPYVLNCDLNATRRLWIHDHVTALRCMHRSNAYKVVGPNLFVLPKDIPEDISFHRTLYLQPCNNSVRLWEYLEFDACPLIAWPVGIDADEFCPSSVPWSERRVMVYHKARDPNELPLIFEALHELRLRYFFVIYGHYSEIEYKQMLAETSFIIWHGSNESQNIAMQEAMACDIPILVCDVRSLSQDKSAYHFDAKLADFPASAAPYFDETCGVRIADLTLIKEALELMMARRNGLGPREFVLKNLSLEKQAREFVHLWDRWGLDFEAGLGEKLNSTRAFRIPLTDRVHDLYKRTRIHLANKL